MTSEPLSSSITTEPEEPPKPFPKFVKVDGYQDFPSLAELFDNEYIKGPPLFDVQGTLIHFHARKPNKFRDFEHAAIGREGVHGARPEPCDTKRASCCVHWIRFVVTHPDVEIFHAPSNLSTGVPPDQERFIYLWKGQEGPGKPFYRYEVVVTRYLNAPDKILFLTAYPVEDSEYWLVKKKHKKLYPVLTRGGRQNPVAAVIEQTARDNAAPQGQDAPVHLIENSTQSNKDENRIVEPTRSVSRNERKRLRKQEVQQ